MFARKNTYFFIVFLATFSNCLSSKIALPNNNGRDRRSAPNFVEGQQSVRWPYLEQRNDRQRQVDYNRNRDNLDDDRQLSFSNYPDIVRESNKETVRTEIRFRNTAPHIEQSFAQRGISRSKFYNDDRNVYVDYNNNVPSPSPPLPVLVAPHLSPLQKPENNDRDNSKNICALNSTGQFPYKSDCRKFVNCFKGHGYVQLCSPGTLFNSETLECDFPNKAKCAYNDVANQYGADDDKAYVAIGGSDSFDATRKTYVPLPVQSFDYNAGKLSAHERPRSYPKSSFNLTYENSLSALSTTAPVGRNLNAHTYAVLSQNFKTDKKHPANYVASFRNVDQSNDRTVSSYNWTKPLFVPDSRQIVNFNRPIRYYPSDENLKSASSTSSTNSDYFYAQPFNENVNQQFHVGIYNGADKNARLKLDNNNNNNNNNNDKLPSFRSSFDQAKCPDGFSGIIAHPVDCSKYLNCDRGRTFVTDCGPGTLFNARYSVCDYPYNVKCQSRYDRDDEISGSGKLMVRMSEDDGSEIDRLSKFQRNDDQSITSFDTIAVTTPSTMKTSTLNNNNNVDYVSDRFTPVTTVIPKFQSVTPSLTFPLRGDMSSFTTTIYPSDYNQLPRYQPPYNVYPDIEPPIVSYSTSKKDLFSPSITVSDGNVDVRTTTTTKEVHHIPANPDTQYEPLNVNSYYDPALINVDGNNGLLNADDNLRKTNVITKEDCSRRPTVRLRGGPSTSEGFLQIEIAPHRWGIVCDEPNKWTMEKANIVCNDLGYERGAEQTWQGWPSIVPIDIKHFSNIAVNRIDCIGNESSYLNCTFKKETVCDVESNAVWIRCMKNPASECHLDEVSFNNTCYKLVIPNEDTARHDSLVGFSKEEAMKHCSSIGGKLLDILTQKENDFISEWLVNQNFMSNVMTSGVGVSVVRMPVWIWEGTTYTLLHQNWWPGWENNTKVMTPVVPNLRAMCVVLQRHFPCSAEKNDSICDVEYFYWNTIDCGNMSSKHPYICERPIDNIGCVDGNGANYVGIANVTAYHSACLYWNSSLVLSALKYKISEKTRSTYLNNHNYCRNPDGIELLPWCYIQTSDNGIQKEFCDIPACDKAINEALLSSRMVQSCTQGFFQCTPNECVTNAQVCDGYTDCSNGADEYNCKSNPLERFIVRPHSYILTRERNYQRKYTNTSLKTCAEICLETIGFSCQSFSHIDSEKTCLITDATESTKGVTLIFNSTWNYYKLKKPDITCPDMFLCHNGLCVDNSNVCNGRNDCGDRTDEKNCSKSSIGYDIRLIGGNSSHEGHVQVKVLGEWGYVCDDMFDTNDGEVVCRELGYAGGIFEVKPHSYFTAVGNTSVENPTMFLLDNLQCYGNESSLTECNFSEWGSHDCSPEEIAGVVCHVGSKKKCNTESFQCTNSGECIPLVFLCDTVNDCLDGSDEDAVRCNTAVEVRLYSDGNRKSGAVFEGRVEVRRFGIWGTVCDDDFSSDEATVVCRSMGFHGPAQALKEAAFGPGEGQIWLDQVHCNGTESSLTECLHSKWGHHNCKHEEDVSVICSPQTSAITTKSNIESVSTSIPVSLPKLEFIKPEQCGLVYVNKQKPYVQGRVVSGYTTIKGTLPWQASIRLRTSGKSDHWCGAVIITKYHVLTAAHCLQGFSKDFYFVRVGDYDTEVKEEHEQEFNIAEFYQHDAFDEGFKLNNDLALIKLKGSGIYFSDYVQPICLPTADLEYKDGLNCSISGWGSDATPGSGYARLLRMAWVPILSQEVCVAKYVYGNMSLSPGMYCAGHLQGGPDSCQGDSGGPMICPIKDNRFVLYGVTSWGHGCGRPNKPGVYTKVAHYINWIENQLVHSSMDLYAVNNKQRTS